MVIYVLKSNSVFFFVFTTFLPGNDYSTNTKKVQKDALPFHVRFFCASLKVIDGLFVRPISMHTSNPL